jgi:hypothetical protein
MGISRVLMKEGGETPRRKESLRTEVSDRRPEPLGQRLTAVPVLGAAPVACDHAALPMFKGSVTLFQARCHFSFEVIGATFRLEFGMIFRIRSLLRGTVTGECWVSACRGESPPSPAISKAWPQRAWSRAQSAIDRHADGHFCG